MRGKVTHRAEHHTAKRITPAYAGKRKCSAASQSGFTDHPRLCGEKISPFNMISITIGSPPPMRGKVWHFAGNCSNDRITPAYAGEKCFRDPTEKFYKKDHPRLCGKVRFPNRSHILSGSPPAYAGKSFNHSEMSENRGITPAYAGKSSDLLGSHNVTKDHPAYAGKSHIHLTALSK